MLHVLDLETSWQKLASLAPTLKLRVVGGSVSCGSPQAKESFARDGDDTAFVCGLSGEDPFPLRRESSVDFCNRL